MLPSATMIDIGANIRDVQGRIAAAAARSGRSEQAVTLMAVTKTVGVPEIRAAAEAGVRVVGENRVQEAERKLPALGDAVGWHLIGKLQSNKARRAALMFDAIHSVDRPRLVSKLTAAAVERPTRLDVYVQVDYVRAGRPEAETEDLARRLCAAVAEADSLRLAGLMTLPPFEPDPESARPWFVRLRELRDRIATSEGLELSGLSMGMSNDFEIAIEEGATIVRVGTTIFGPRECAIPAPPD
jgi:pyridoxal phosphate enzyme (YggS family)